MSNNLIDFLGKNVSEMLTTNPFNSWTYICNIVTDIDEIRIYYVCKKKGLEIICNSNNRVCTIFIKHDMFNDFYTETKFDWKRIDVRNYFGSYIEFRKKYTDPILGKDVEADIFTSVRAKVHVEYLPVSGAVKMYTFMIPSI